MKNFFRGIVFLICIVEICCTLVELMTALFLLMDLNIYLIVLVQIVLMTVLIIYLFNMNTIIHINYLTVALIFISSITIHFLNLPINILGNKYDSSSPGYAVAYRIYSISSGIFNRLIYIIIVIISLLRISMIKSKQRYLH